VAKALFSVRLSEFIRSTTFRWTLAVSGMLVAFVLLMFGFVLAQSYTSMTADVDRLIGEVATDIANSSPEERLQKLDQHLRVDPRRVKLGGWFDGDGARIVGNIESLPAGLRRDNGPQSVDLVRDDALGHERQTVRVVARSLPNRETLVIGRIDYEFFWIMNVLQRALAIGLIPALCLSFVVGAFLTVRSQQRVEKVNRTVQRFVAGQLQERVPTRGSNDSFGRLETLVNGALDEIETLVRRLAGVGDDIAHDLRTPLTRVRVLLERSRQKAGSLDELQTSVDQAIVGLDQSLAIITALLRIAEIEHRRRMDAFGSVALADLVREVGELYEPIAEDKNVAFAINAHDGLIVRGDRDLLFEAIANLVDNAVKFTPEGGRVEVDVLRSGDEAVVRVRDTGPGIAVGEEELVAKRFYRSEKSRRDPGLGLGLSLVSAIAKLHGFRFSIAPGPGCVTELAGSQAAV
jgi:signal transduction histidine kinase